MVYARVQCQEPKTSFYREDDLLFLSSYYLSMRQPLDIPIRFILGPDIPTWSNATGAFSLNNPPLVYIVNHHQQMIFLKSPSFSEGKEQNVFYVICKKIKS